MREETGKSCSVLVSCVRAQLCARPSSGYLALANEMCPPLLLSSSPFAPLLLLLSSPWPRWCPDEAFWCPNEGKHKTIKRLAFPGGAAEVHKTNPFLQPCYHPQGGHGTKTRHRDTTGATARRGGGAEEEEERRRGGRISFARARYLEDGLAQSCARTHDTNTEHVFPVPSLNLQYDTTAAAVKQNWQ